MTMKISVAEERRKNDKMHQGMSGKIGDEFMYERKRKIGSKFAVFIFASVTAILIAEQGVVKEAVAEAVKMCLSSIVPAIFPFMILSDFLCAYGITGESKIGKIFQKCFHINSSATAVFTLGNVCGFPVGARVCGELFSRKIISKDECERLMGFCNNPSLAFVISAVGLGMNGSVARGILLYISLLFSSIIIGAFSGKNKSFSENQGKISGQNFSIIESIKASGFAVIGVCCYVIFFSIVARIAMEIIKVTAICALLLSALEVGSACAYIANADIAEILRLPLTAFALGFSGMSVFLQTQVFLPRGINRKKIIIMKISEGVIAALLVFVLQGFLWFFI